MKTLDEVIKGFECCQNVGCDKCPYKILFNDDTHVPCDQLEKDEDALHYLQEYKKLKRTAKVVHKQETHIVKPPKSTTIAYETETNLWDECGNCGAMGMYHGWNYCPVCGAKLDWGE